MKTLPPGLQERNYHPRGCTDCDLLRTAFPEASDDDLEEFEGLFVAAELGEANDRLELLWDEQDSVTERLLGARPTTLKGTLTLLRVWCARLEEEVDESDDYLKSVYGGGSPGYR